MYNNHSLVCLLYKQRFLASLVEWKGLLSTQLAFPTRFFRQLHAYDVARPTRGVILYAGIASIISAWNFSLLLVALNPP